MSTHSKRAGLWSVEGPGVLAREQDLVLLSNLADGGLVDKLVDLLAETADSGGDGLQFARAVEDVLDADGAWRLWQEGHEGPALVAFGPVGQGLAVTVTGTAWVAITTASTTRRIEAGPWMLLHCLVGSPVQAVQGALGTGQQEGPHTDRFSRLDVGVVRAGGFSYHAAHPASPAAEPVGATPVPIHPDSVPELARHAPAVEPAADSPPKPAVASPRVPGSSPGAAPTGAGVLPPSEAVPPFESVLLLGGQAEGEAEERQPLPPGADRARQVDRASEPAEILGVRCKNGHFDDPDARFCAVCGISMNQQTLVPKRGVRPPLGLLVLDDGAIFQLDADYVIGREPTLDAAVAAGKARPLRIADSSGTLSRVHAKVELDGWRVLVSDLGSANGTEVRLPGDPAGQQLTPRMPVRLVPGSYVDLGGAGFHYESHRGR